MLNFVYSSLLLLSFFSGYGALGRLGVGGTDSVCQPTLLESIQHVCIKQVCLFPRRIHFSGTYVELHQISSHNSHRS